MASDEMINADLFPHIANRLGHWCFCLRRHCQINGQMMAAGGYGSGSAGEIVQGGRGIAAERHTTEPNSGLIRRPRLIGHNQRPASSARSSRALQQQPFIEPLCGVKLGCRHATTVLGANNGIASHVSL
jgi:hypothetical protein